MENEQSKTDVLKPCPFCGEEELVELPKWAARQDYNPHGEVFCGGCGARGPIRDAAGQRADAVERWNTRAALTPKDTKDGEDVR